MKNGLDVLVYSDGRKFEASTPGGLIAKKKYSTSSCTTDYVLSTGTYIHTDGHRVYFKDGNPIIKYMRDITANPVEVDNYRVYMNHRLYDGSIRKHDIEKLRCLLNNDVVGYFGLDHLKTDLQKKVFAQTEEYKSIYLPRLQKEKSYLYQDEYIVRLPIKDRDEDLKEFKYDISSGRFLFEIRDKENKKINEGYSNFHFLFHENLCLTYPRSLVSMTIGRNYFNETLYVQNAQTCKVSESDALKVENNFNYCDMIWVFKFEKIKDSYIYGKTTQIYIADRRTGEIYCNLSNSLGSSHKSFKSTNVIKYKPTKKKKYHSKGRIENCGMCLGTGKGWQGGLCSFCAGRGWTIEHYW